ncbi:lysophospholipid acyltransferase family protein [Candidatus Deianiraea vastatrix]|uniref:1-acylglycerol-3-phosphate O-acyltransferase n=1 Tax=Candidatus Deianiraea vastatrix TaxID=2163644 RepID=A0A5B8XE13_9RICK|nr:lysophospholipid acyltransferase family protein [Candidatus Deianiraea vastatrix]QED23503.1 1-acylglycerol-3-phosphate O-acyltransferase [Candidatus Deianiraea vastatrix]
MTSLPKKCNAISSLVFTIFFAAWTILCAIIGFPIGVSKKHAIKLGRFWANGVLFALKHICNITCDAKNVDEISQYSLILSKHQSAFETIFFLAKIKNPCFVLKSDLLKIPFYGWYLKNMGMIPVSRKISISEIKSMNNAIINAIKSGKNVILFPQGTRVCEKTLYENGYKNHVKYKFACLDIFSKISSNLAAVSINSGFFWPKKGLYKYSGEIYVKLVYTRAINPQDYDNKSFIIAIKEEIEAAIEADARLYAKTVCDSLK